MLDSMAFVVVVVFNLAFLAVVLRYAWRRMGEAERREGPGEDRRHIDAFYAERRER